MRGRGKPPRNAVLERHLGPERYAKTLLIGSDIETPSFLAMEQAALDVPIEEVIARAEQAEEDRHLRLYGPDGAPPRPPWPSEWRSCCEEWVPTGVFVSCRHQRPAPPAPPPRDSGHKSWV